MQTDKFNIETVTHVHFWNEKLFTFRTTRSPSFRFTAGQFSRVGLEIDGKVVARPYSMVSCDYDEYLEFLSIVVPDGELTSTLSKIKVGDQVFIDKRGLGYLTVDQFQTPIDTLYLLATGTGIAPFISIIRLMYILENVNKICLIHSVREDSELVYKEQIEQLYDLRYIPIVTRNPASPYYNTRIPAYVESNILPTLQPNDKFMLCGNPDMIRDTRALLDANGIHVNRGATLGRYIVENAF